MKSAIAFLLGMAAATAIGSRAQTIPLATETPVTRAYKRIDLTLNTGDKLQCALNAQSVTLGAGTILINYTQGSGTMTGMLVASGTVQ